MISKRLGRVAQGWRDISCILAIVLMVAHSHYNVRATRDVGADDEAWYVAGGLLFGKPGFPNGPDGWPIPELGSLHCLAYFALSKLYAVPLELYYASWQLRITLIALAMFVLVRRARCPWWQALAASFTFVNCAIADVWPFPVHTATLIVLVGLIAASFGRTTVTVLGIVTVTFAFAGFCRPELLYAYGVAVVLFVVYLIRETTRAAGSLEGRWRVGLLWAVAVVVPAVLLEARLGNPLGGTRSYYAFAQHYTLGLFEAQGNELDPWANWMPTVARDFPGASTVSEAMRANPTAFLGHVARNVARMPRNTMLATIPLLETSPYVERALWALGVVYTIVQVVRMVRERSSRSTNPSRTVQVFALTCGIVPFALSIVIVHPRLHYYVLVVVLGITLVASYPLPRLRSKWELSRGASVALVFATCVLAVSLTATKSGAASLAEWIADRPTKRDLFGDRQRTATRLRELGLEGKVTVLEYAWGTCFYAGYDCEPYLRWDKLMPFGQFLTERRIDVVIVDDEMLRDVRFVDDAECADFFAHPARYGFELETVPGTRVQIGIRVGRRPTAAHASP